MSQKLKKKLHPGRNLTSEDNVRTLTFAMNRMCRSDLLLEEIERHARVLRNEPLSVTGLVAIDEIEEHVKIVRQMLTSARVWTSMTHQSLFQ